MKITLEVPDHKAAFVMELLQSIPFIKAKAVRSKAKPQDETEYLLSTEANRKALTASIEALERGEFTQHDLIEG
ncbi:hypothetical protein EJV47_09825 [Hymenobacter gummosus]|uniref:Antitoxin n=1 Tax=Hymenobacter gummosus TaxID=1776032 RepID=A0A431U5I8_9BACT|nr:hypothetical protein [Hymenobacter gummosus]RTQ50902.1 hypothetical protein EJV47_09825 [Hymenobacter gummosus]